VDCYTDSTGRIHVRSVGTVSTLWCFPEGERVILEFNEAWQPVGTSGSKFRRLAGQYVRSGSFVGLSEPNWRNIPNARKEPIWEALMVCIYDDEMHCFKYLCGNIYAS
jgi:hypothetical protein